MVVCKSLGSDKYLNHIDHVMVLRQSAGVLPARCLKISTNICLNFAIISSVRLFLIPSLIRFSMKILVVIKLLVSKGECHDMLINGCIDQKMSTDRLIETPFIHNVVSCRISRVDEKNHVFNSPESCIMLPIDPRYYMIR